MRWTRIVSAVGVVACSMAAPLAGSPVVAAAPAASTNYSSWTFTGTTNRFTGTVGMAPGFPAVTLVSNSRTPPTPPVASGTSVWLPRGTPFADTFGTSQGQPYLNLRPAADNPTSPSTTTYTFGSPTPIGTWAVNFGDIDAEILTVTATGTGGGAVSAADLGFHTVYNYCDASPRSSSCSGGTAPFPVPSVIQTGDSLVVQDLLCPAQRGRCDTQGESAWLQPRVPLSSLTVTSIWKQGFPSYQTWFATGRGTVTGKLDVPCPLTDGPTVQLLRDGATIATTTPNTDGAYTFSGVARGVKLDVQVDPASLPSNASAAPQTVGPIALSTLAPDLQLTYAWTVAGSITGTPHAGLDVALQPGTGGPVRHTNTTATGRYTFTDVPTGQYTVTPTPTPGDTIIPTTTTVAVGCQDEQVPPFVLTPPPTTSSIPTTAPADSTEPTTTTTASTEPATTSSTDSTPITTASTTTASTPASPTTSPPATDSSRSPTPTSSGTATAHTDDPTATSTTVTPHPEPTSATGSTTAEGNLANTGVGLRLITIIGALLIMVGILGVAATARRRSEVYPYNGRFQRPYPGPRRR